MGLGRLFGWFGLPGALVLTVMMSIYAVGAACAFPAWTTALAAAGMLLSSLGDIILMDYKPITAHLPLRGFAAGAGAFMAAHLCYIAAFLIGGASAKASLSLLGVAVGSGTFLAALLLLLILHRRNARAKPSMTLLCTVYLAVISCCLAAAFTFSAARGGGGWATAVGAALFFLSDAIIGFDWVGGLRLPRASDVIWVLYPLGQILMLTGLWV